jgi:hypothetical protein
LWLVLSLLQAYKTFKTTAIAKNPFFIMWLVCIGVLIKN